MRASLSLISFNFSPYSGVSASPGGFSLGAPSLTATAPTLGFGTPKTTAAATGTIVLVSRTYHHSVLRLPWLQHATAVDSGVTSCNMELISLIHRTFSVWQEVSLDALLFQTQETRHLTRQ